MAPDRRGSLPATRVLPPLSPLNLGCTTMSGREDAYISRMQTSGFFNSAALPITFPHGGFLQTRLQPPRLPSPLRRSRRPTRAGPARYRSSGYCSPRQGRFNWRQKHLTRRTSRRIETVRDERRPLLGPVRPVRWGLPHRDTPTFPNREENKAETDPKDCEERSEGRASKGRF